MRVLSTLLLTGLMAVGALANAATPETATATATPAVAHVAQKDKAAGACRKQAEHKNLDGLARDNFMKDCLAGKATLKK